MLQFLTVSKSFNSQKVLDEITFTVNDGEKLVIAGKSGAGKSVILKLATGLLKPDAGTISIDGRDTGNFSQKQWNETLNEFGFVFQGGALFDSMNIEENAGLKLAEDGRLSSQQIHIKVMDALAKVGLDAGILKKMPSELSGGMRKRVAIARAIIHQPKYLLYDEPTTGLDPQNAGMIDALIAELAAQPGITTIVVTHDLESIRSLAGTVMLLDNRRLAFTGKTGDFFRAENESVRSFLARVPLR